MMGKQLKTPPDNKMNEYQILPAGMWHMLAAVMLMVLSLSIALMSTSELVSVWLSERTLMYLELALLVVMVLTLATPTFLMSRGWSVCHRFLIWHNRFYIFMLGVVVCILFVAGNSGMALTGLLGVILAVCANLLYRSRRYGDGVEYYRLIWANHRSKQRG
jgi:uncharacterized membrane protein